MKRRFLILFDPARLVVLFSGIVAISSVFLRHIPLRIATWVSLFPKNTTHVAMFTIGLALIYFSEQIARRKTMAWYAAVGLFILVVFLEVLRYTHPLLLAVYCLSLGLLVVKKREFVIKSDVTSLRRAVTLAAAQLAVVTIVVGLVFITVDQRQFGHNITGQETVVLVVKSVFGKPLPSYVHASREDRVLISSVRVAAIFGVITIFINLFRPLSLRVKASHANRDRARSILEKFSDSPEDFFKLYPEDKHYFFYLDSFIAYAVHYGAALVLDGAGGNPRRLRELRRSFLEHCRLNGWSIGIVHCSDKESAAWEELGFNSLRIGSESVIDCDVFVATTMHNKHFRYVKNRAEKDRLRVEFWQPPLSVEQINILNNISNAWLSADKREYSFAMAPFSASYLRQTGVAVLLQQNQPVAYVNFIPIFKAQEASIDHMRSRHEVSAVAMHFLLQQSIAWVHQSGVKHFNLGLAPLAKIEEDPKGVSDKLLVIVKRLGRRYYSFQGLEQFKNKFEPNWTGKHLSYQGGPSELLRVVSALRSALTYRQPRQLVRRYWPLVVMLLAVALYASFPLATILNPAYAWHGLVSVLGEKGQPFAWLFNDFDIISGVAIVLLLSWLWYTHHLSDKKLRRVALLAIIANVGAVLAAVVPLPVLRDGFSHYLTWQTLQNPLLIIHGSASFLNSAGFVVAVVLWACWSLRHHRSKWRPALAITIVAISTIGYAIGELLAPISPTLQRLFIVLYALWFVVMLWDVLHTHHKNTHLTT